MKYNLRAELSVFMLPDEPDAIESYDWTLCKLDTKGGIIQYVYLGNRPLDDPITEMIMDLIDTLNKDSEQKDTLLGIST